MKFSLPKNLRSQIAIIITFVIAAIILFAVIFINIAKVSEVKTTTSQTVDRAALSLASQIGSLSHFYTQKIKDLAKELGEEVSQDEDKLSVCTSDWFNLDSWITLGKAFVTMLFTPNPIAVPQFLSTTMSSSVTEKFNKDISKFNALRESMLLQAASSLQSDSTVFFQTAENSGIFYDDTNNNGAFDTGEPQYDLSAVSGMTKQKKVDRFTTWYYQKRLPLVGDEGLKTELNTFITRLKDFVDVDEWGADRWNIKKASFVIEPATSESASPSYRVTCGDSCPSWVANRAWPNDPESRRIRIISIDRDNTDSDDNYIPSGFLKDKFISLSKRLEDTDSYDLSFCGSSWWSSECGSIDDVIYDLTIFLGRTKDVLDLPISQRLTDVKEWFPRFYDFDKHDEEDANGNGDYREPNDPDDPNKYTYDIYLRLMRDEQLISSWITELETLNNNTITDEIETAYGECTWGRGDAVSSSCDASYGANCDECGCNKCSDDPCCSCKTCCYNPITPCAWKGTYYTCCPNPPVCANGDLYGDIPDWCSVHQDHSGCNSHCGCTVNSFDCTGDSQHFQGQLAYNNTSGSTEVGQAIGILTRLKEDLKGDIAKLKMTIADFAERLADLTPDTSPKRNEFAYGWKDKSGFSHLVYATIQGRDDTISPPLNNILGYPDKALPEIVETRQAGTLQKCYVLENRKGSFIVTAYRYDEDIPITQGTQEQWKLRLRKQPGQAEFSLDKLEAMINDIQANGRLNLEVFFDTGDVLPGSFSSIYTFTDVNDLLTNYAISSKIKAHYGPEKEDIYIEKLQ